MTKKQKLLQLFHKWSIQLLLLVIAVLLLANVVDNQGLFAKLSFFKPFTHTTQPIHTPIPVSQSDLVNPVKQFYSDISSKQYAVAWGLLSKNFQNYAQNYGNFIKGYNPTLNTIVKEIHVQDLSDRIVYVQLESSDNLNGQIQTKTFSGTWKLAQEDGEWKLDSANITLTSISSSSSPISEVKQAPKPQQPSERALKVAGYTYALYRDEEARNKIRELAGMPKSDENTEIIQLGLWLDKNQGYLAKWEAALDNYRLQQSQAQFYAPPQLPAQNNLQPLNCTSNTIGSYTYTNCY